MVKVFETSHVTYQTTHRGVVVIVVVSPKSHRIDESIE